LTVRRLQLFETFPAILTDKVALFARDIPPAGVNEVQLEQAGVNVSFLRAVLDGQTFDEPAEVKKCCHKVS